jgi:hypothetical protein
MKNIKVYEMWLPSERAKHSEEDEKEEDVELLSKILDASKKDIISHFNSRLMDVDFVEVSDPQQFVVEIWGRAFDGRIPSRISYYIDDIAEILSEEFGTKIDWQFSPNGNTGRIEFNLEKEIDPKYLRVKEIIKLA